MRKWFVWVCFCMTFGFVNAGEFAPTFHEPNLWRSLHVKSHRKLAKSNPIYENVRYLKGVNTAEHKTVYGNAVYLSNRLCITAAHLLFDDFIYEIEFSIENKQVKKHQVLYFVKQNKISYEMLIPQDFYESVNIDLAILILKDDVEGLQPLPIPSLAEYNFGMTERYMNVQSAPKLLTVGYGPDYMWDGFIRGPNPKERKAFWLITYVIIKNMLLSLPYGLSPSLERRRPFIAFEGQTCEGYSGSAVFDAQQGLVGLVVAGAPPKGKDIVCLGVTVRKDWMRDVNNTRLSARTMWVLLAIGYYMIPVYSFFYNIMKYFDVEEYMPNHTWFTKPCGTFTTIMLLPRHKEWIDKIRREEIGSDV